MSTITNRLPSDAPAVIGRVASAGGSVSNADDFDLAGYIAGEILHPACRKARVLGCDREGWTFVREPSITVTLEPEELAMARQVGEFDVRYSEDDGRFVAEGDLLLRFTGAVGPVATFSIEEIL